jgi:hypothetical protein
MSPIRKSLGDFQHNALDASSLKVRKIKGNHPGFRQNWEFFQIDFQFQDRKFTSILQFLVKV